MDKKLNEKSGLLLKPKAVFLMLICLIVPLNFLVGCGSSPRMVRDELLRTIDDPHLKGKKVRHLVNRSLEQSEVIRKHNCDKRAIAGKKLPDQCKAK